MTYQWDSLKLAMSGNLIENNIIVTGSSSGGSGYSDDGTPTAPTIKNNAYYNYAGTLVDSSGGDGSDANPTYENPDISCWDPSLSATSPVYGAPVSFAKIKGGWGPPGFVLPRLARPPPGRTAAEPAAAPPRVASRVGHVEASLFECAACSTPSRRDCCEDVEMTSMDTALLESLADCLETGSVISDALRSVATAGGTAEAWAKRILLLVRADIPLATLLRTAKVIDDSECELLSADGADDIAAAVLHVVVARRRRQLARRRSIQLGLAGPFGVGALTVVLDPIPNLITGGSYVWPVFRGFVVLGLLAVGIIAGIPTFLSDKRRRTKVLGFCAALPGIRWFAKLYAEEELTTALLPFVAGGHVGDAGLRAASVLLGWSKLGEAMRLAENTVGRPPLPPLGGLEAIAGQLTLATKLAVVGGVASKRLAERLTQRGEAIAVLLTARARVVVRLGAYGIIVVFSICSLAGMLARGLPGMPTLPGAAGNVDQKQIEELMKQLEQQ